MVSSDVTEAVPVIAAGCEALHVGGFVAPAGLEVMAQARATVPVKPPLGAIVTVEVVTEPWVTAAAVEAVIEYIGPGFVMI
jgi:hypothetical protein